MANVNEKEIKDASKIGTNIQFKRANSRTNNTEYDNIPLNKGEPLFIPDLNQLRIGKKDVNGTASKDDSTIFGPASLSAEQTAGGAKLVFTNSDQSKEEITIEGSDNLSVGYTDGKLTFNGTAEIIFKDNPTEEDNIKALGPGTNNSIGIVKRSIDGTHDQYTAYVHNGTNWQAMDGNYSADDVYFSDDFLVTTSFGNLEASLTDAKEVKAKGKSLSSLIKKYWSTASTAQPTQPAITQFKVYGYTTNSGTDEIGSTVTSIDYKTLVTTGKYTYGAKVTYTDGSWQVIKAVNMTPTYTINSTNIEGNKTGATGTNVDLKGTGVYLDTTSSKTICTLAASVTFSNRYVVGDEVGSRTVKSVEVLNSLQEPQNSIDPLLASYTKTASDTLKITPFRNNCFYVFDKTNSITSSNITSLVTSNYLRAGTSSKSTSIELTVPAGTKSIVLAVLGTKTKLTEAYNKTVNADMINSFKYQQGVQVSGYTAGKDLASYTVFYYTPDTPYTQPATIEIIA